jgi:hypothetical protein
LTAAKRTIPTSLRFHRRGLARAQERKPHLFKVSTAGAGAFRYRSLRTASDPSSAPTSTRQLDGILCRVVKRLVAVGLASSNLLKWTSSNPDDEQFVRIVAGIASSGPGLTFAEIDRGLQAMGESTPRGDLRWLSSSVKNLLDRAVGRGLVVHRSADLSRVAPHG